MKFSKRRALIGFSVNPETTWNIIRQDGERIHAEFDTHMSGTSFDVALALKACGVTPFIIGAIGPNSAKNSMVNAETKQGLRDSKIRAKLLPCRESSGLASIVPGRNIRLGHKGPITRSISNEAVQIDADFLPDYVIATGVAGGSEEELDSLKGLFSSPAIKILMPGFTLTANAPMFKKALAISDMVVMNEHEAANFLRVEPGKLTVKSIRKLLRFGPKVAVVTLGKRGVIAASSEPRSTFEIRGQEVETVDETGAGDCFCGFLIGALSRGDRSLEDSLKIATIAGALKASRLGTTNIPSWDEVISLM